MCLQAYDTDFLFVLPSPLPTFDEQTSGKGLQLAKIVPEMTRPRRVMSLQSHRWARFQVDVSFLVAIISVIVQAYVLTKSVVQSVQS